MEKNLLRWGIWVLAASTATAPLWADQLVKVDGTVSGFTGLTDNDNIVDGALVLPSFSSADLLQFQINEFMGPSENMTIGGFFSAQVPSNFYLPSQTESYGIFPVTFAKENFSIYVPQGAQEEVIAAWFEAPWDQLLDIVNNKQPTTDIIPYLTLKGYGYQEAQDLSAASDLSLNLDIGSGDSVNYAWQRGSLATGDMDGLFLFQGTKTKRWSFANLLGSPAAQGSVSGVSGLADSYELIFMRTHMVNNNFTAAEGWIRGATTADTISVQDTPASLGAVLVNAGTVTWPPISAPGWVSLVIAPNQSSTPRFAIANILSGIVPLDVTQQTQIWIDPTLGTTQTGLDSTTLKTVSVVLAFIGTTEAVPMPQVGADETSFLNAASEIRMTELQ